MGSLVTLNSLALDPSWYFPDSHYSWESRRWVYKWPSEYFSHVVGIHADDFRSHPARKTEIRKWIEINVEGTVIINEIDKNYRVYYGKERDWDHSYERTNKWYAFYFESEESAFMFRLRFSEYIKEITDLHPTSGDEYEKTSYHKTY
jgi:hypothetical protein